MLYHTAYVTDNEKLGTDLKVTLQVSLVIPTCPRRLMTFVVSRRVIAQEEWPYHYCASLVVPFFKDKKTVQHTVQWGIHTVLQPTLSKHFHVNDHACISIKGFPSTATSSAALCSDQVSYLPKVA